MLILFHFLHIIIRRLMRKRKQLQIAHEFQKRCSQSIAPFENFDFEEQTAEHDLKFDPPVYRQRYGKVFALLQDELWQNQVEKLVDFGCAEFGLFVFIKRLSNLMEVSFVDIEEDLLKDHINRVQPLTIEYLQRRTRPFSVNVFAGSVADPDYRLLNTDAVTAIELIEHVYPDTLDAFPYNIFSYIEPKIAILSTPNADFNVLFPGLQKFRHYDHKFEWTREEFEDWCRNITVRYPDYCVRFLGIGDGPQGTEHLGSCSQMAVFTRRDIIDPSYILTKYSISCICDDQSPCKKLTDEAKLLCKCVCVICLPNKSVGVCTHCSHSLAISNADQNPEYNIYYKAVERIEYPFEIDTRSEEEKMTHEVQYKIRMYGHVNGRYYNAETSRAEIPLVELLYGFDCCTMSQLKKILEKLNCKVEECLVEETGLIEKCALFDPDMDDDTSENSEASGYDSDHTTEYQKNCDVETESNWDVDSTEKNGWDTEEQSNNKETNSTPVLAESSEPEAEKKPHDSLFDSGYLKSISTTGDSPQTPSEAFDLFEDPLSTNTSALTVESSESNEPELVTKLDTNKINELDGYTNQNQSYPHFPKPNASQFLKDTVPGPSNAAKKKLAHSDSEEDSSLDDVRSIAQCLLENTLNKIDVVEEVVQPIELFDFDFVVPEPILMVENGDLANNNRDGEGNNYPAEEELLMPLPFDDFNDNVEIVEDGNNNENDDDLVIEAEVVNVVEDADLPVAQASREVLVDSNSIADSLDDFDLPAEVEDEGSGFIIGIQYLPEDPDADLFVENPNEFPFWLLQILGAQIIANPNDQNNPANSHDEPHFYCQGDGLGVHPSVVAVDADEDLTSNSSSVHSVDVAEEDQTANSEIDTAPSLSLDLQSAAGTSENTTTVATSVRSESEEFFDASANFSI